MSGGVSHRQTDGSAEALSSIQYLTDDAFATPPPLSAVEPQ